MIVVTLCYRQGMGIRTTRVAILHTLLRDILPCFIYTYT